MKKTACDLHCQGNLEDQCTYSNWNLAQTLFLSKEKKKKGKRKKFKHFNKAQEHQLIGDMAYILQALRFLFNSVKGRVKGCS